MANSITVGGADVNSITVGGTPVKLVAVGNTVIWQNFNPSFSRKITSTGATPVTTYTHVADNVTAFQIGTTCKDVFWHASSAAIWVRLVLSPSLNYEFVQRSWDNGAFSVPNTSLTVRKNDVQVYTTTVLVSSAESGGGISFTNYWSNRPHEEIKVQCSIWGVGYFESESANMKSYYTGLYPRLYYACMPGDNAGDISYYINTSSYR